MIYLNDTHKYYDLLRCFLGISYQIMCLPIPISHRAFNIAFYNDEVMKT